MLNFKKYFLNYYQALKSMYVDDIAVYNNFTMVKSDIIDDGIWNFIFDVKAKNYKKYKNIFNGSKEKFGSLVPRFYVLASDKCKFLEQLKTDYNIYCEDSWFKTSINNLNLNYKAKIDVDVQQSKNKQEIIDCIMDGFSTGDPNDPYGDLSPTYRESLNKKLFTSTPGYNTYHYTATCRGGGKAISIASITICGKNAYLNNVTTLKEYKGKAISKQVLSYLVEDLKNKKIKNIIFATEKGAYTEQYYKKLGFKIVDYGYCFEEKE